MEISFLIFFTNAVLAMASAMKKDDESLLSELSKKRDEIEELFRQENKALRKENEQLQEEDGRLRARDELLQEQIVKLRDEKLHERLIKLQEEKNKLRQLRQADSKLEREQTGIVQVERKTNDSIRQHDVALETMKLIESQIDSLLRKRGAISEVEFIGGSAQATSVHSDNNGCRPNNAFVRGNSKSHYGWCSGIQPENKGIYPQMLWYDFTHNNSFVPARVSFRGETKCDSCKKFTPSVWEFVGSNDDVCTGSGNWTVLCQDSSDVVIKEPYETKYCDVISNDPKEDQKEYRCLGINVIRAHNPWTGLSNVRMWKKVKINAAKQSNKGATNFE